jgi:hypothetical protein
MLFHGTPNATMLTVTKGGCEGPSEAVGSQRGRKFRSLDSMKSEFILLLRNGRHTTGKNPEDQLPFSKDCLSRLLVGGPIRALALILIPKGKGRCHQYLLRFIRTLQSGLSAPYCDHILSRNIYQ